MLTLHFFLVALHAVGSALRKSATPRTLLNTRAFIQTACQIILPLLAAVRGLVCFSCPHLPSLPPVNTSYSRDYTHFSCLPSLSPVYRRRLQSCRRGPCWGSPTSSFLGAVTRLHEHGVAAVQCTQKYRRPRGCLQFWVRSDTNITDSKHSACDCHHSSITRYHRGESVSHGIT